MCCTPHIVLNVLLTTIRRRNKLGITLSRWKDTNNRNIYEIWHFERQVPMYVRITKGSDHKISEVQIRFCGVKIEEVRH